MSLAASVIAAAMGGKQYSPGSSGLWANDGRLGLLAVHGDWFRVVPSEFVPGHLGVNAVGRGVGQDFQALGQPSVARGLRSFAAFDDGFEQVIAARLDRGFAEEFDWMETGFGVGRCEPIGPPYLGVGR
jgi:hypothetical protein